MGQSACWYPPIRSAICCIAMASLCCPAASVDLAAAYKAALSQESGWRAAKAAADAGRERLPQARSALLPNIAFSAGRNLNKRALNQTDLLGRPSTTDDRYFSRNETITLRQPIYKKSLFANLEQAQISLRDVDATLDRERQNLAMRVAAAYFDVLLAQDQLKLVQAQRHAAHIRWVAAQKMFSAGSGTRTDIDQAQARIDSIVAAELEATQGIDYAQRALALLTHLEVSSLAPLLVNSLADVGKDLPAISYWIALAEENSPELISLKARFEMSQKEVEKAKSGHFPTLDAFAQMSRSASETVTSPASSYLHRTIGLQLNIPLYAGGGVNSAVRQTLADQNRAEELIEAGRRDLNLRLHREYRGVTEGLLRIRALEQAVKSARQLETSSQRSFEGGAKSILDVINAEEQSQLAMRNLAQARYDYLLAYVRLNVLAGNDDLQTIDKLSALVLTPQK